MPQKTQDVSGDSGIEQHFPKLKDAERKANAQNKAKTTETIGVVPDYTSRKEQENARIGGEIGSLPVCSFGLHFVEPNKMVRGFLWATIRRFR